MPTPFNSDLILEEKISETSFRAYCAGFDQNKFPFDSLVNVISKVIPEFALGYHESTHIPLPLIVEKLREAAETVYTTQKYEKRGEFGELILHLLLRDFHHSIPLLSKIYFKDTANAVVHGFDGIHITIEGEVKKLWLGESKLYKNGESGVKELAKDVKKHVNADFLKAEFKLIKRKLPENIPEIEYWRNLLSPEQKIDNIFNNIVIPLVCTYSSDTYKNHNEETKQFINDFLSECNNLNGIFNNNLISTDIEIILMLLPVPDKDELNSALDMKLKNMQGL